jgi:hypothetical protein
MRARTNLAAATPVASGAMLGWLATSGRLTQWAHAQETQGQASPKGGAGLSPVPLPPPAAPTFDTGGDAGSAVSDLDKAPF